MTDYFKPLRRKIGVVMLVTASAFMAVWVRGEIVITEFTIPVSDDVEWFVAMRSRVIFCLKYLKTTTGASTQFQALAHYSIPYWSIVVPLTLISAWLLLSKPRTKIEPRQPKPIPEPPV